MKSCLSKIENKKENLLGQLQTIAYSPDRNTSEKRSPLWVFEKAQTFHHNLIQRAYRFSKQNCYLILTMSANNRVEEEISSLS